MAVLVSLLHLIPLAGAIALLVLHWTKFWVGGASDNGTTLQFILKAHELFMQTSLVDVLLYIIRSQALNGYLPLGALAGAAQPPQLSYLGMVSGLFFRPCRSNFRHVAKSHIRFVHIGNAFVDCSSWPFISCSDDPSTRYAPFGGNHGSLSQYFRG